jgi:hypothetical protein
MVTRVNLYNISWRRVKNTLSLHVTLPSRVIRIQLNTTRVTMAIYERPVRDEY